MDKKILIIGGGGREHALGWKIKQSNQVGKVFFAPGNAGTLEVGENIDINVDDIEKLADFAKNNKIDLTVVGPELPLSLGIVDFFKNHGLTIFGPEIQAARLETDKAWADAFFTRHAIPHPQSKTFVDFESASKYIEKKDPEKIVIKASGLAAGKGVILPVSEREALSVVEQMLSGKMFGRAGEEVLVQDRLSGPEISVMAFVDGENIIPMLASQDHKRAFEKDKGPNTGGMGAYAPVSFFDKKMMEETLDRILKPTIQGLKKEQIYYHGVLYAGLMIVQGQPQLLEYNVRFGDPECQPLMMMLKSDLYQIIQACISESLTQDLVEFYEGASVCIIAASKGYPGKYKTGHPIEGLGKKYNKNLQVFHSGTKREGGKIVTDGGRVLGVTSRSENLQKALDKAYAAIGQKGIYFDQMHYRRDIAYQALK